MSDAFDDTVRRAVADGVPDAPWVTELLVGELTHTRARTNAMLHTAPDAILGLDPRGRVRICNEAAVTLLGRDLSELVDTPVVEVLGGPWSEQLRRVLAARGEPRVLIRGDEWEVRPPGRPVVPVEVVLSRTPIDDELAFTLFLRDISDRVADRQEMERLVDELRAATRRAEEASQAKNDFLSGMSHELRTPLNAILGFAELLRLEADDDLDTESVDHILRAGRHLLALVEDVLDITRIEAGGLRLELEPVELAEVIDTAVEMVGPAAADAGLAIVVEPDDEGPVVAVADGRRVLQVLVNLVNNAVKYAGSGATVTVGARRVRQGRVLVTVADDGPGIPAERREAAFEVFERLDAEGTAIEGTGVGLSLCRRLAEAMDGGLRLTGTPGGGLTVVVDLPAA